MNVSVCEFSECVSVSDCASLSSCLSVNESVSVCMFECE